MRNIAEREDILPLTHEKIVVLHGDGKHYHEMEMLVSKLARMVKSHDALESKEVLRNIIPEYIPDVIAI